MKSLRGKTFESHRNLNLFLDKNKKAKGNKGCNALSFSMVLHSEEKDGGGSVPVLYVG